MHGEKCHFHLHVRAPRPSMVRRKFLIKLGNRGENYGPCHISLNATFFWGALQILSRSWELRFFSKLVNKVVPRRVNWTIFTTFVCTWHHSPCTFACFVSWQNSVWGRRCLSFFFLHTLKVTFFLGNFLFFEALLKGMQLCNYLLLNSSFFQRSLFAFA